MHYRPFPGLDPSPTSMACTWASGPIYWLLTFCATAAAIFPLPWALERLTIYHHSHGALTGHSHAIYRPRPFLYKHRMCTWAFESMSWLRVCCAIAAAAAIAPLPWALERKAAYCAPVTDCVRLHTL